MPIKTIKIENMKDGWSDSDVRMIQMDSVDDAGNLPTDCSPGSWAYTPDLNALYIMANDGTWKRAI